MPLSDKCTKTMDNLGRNLPLLMIHLLKITRTVKGLKNEKSSSNRNGNSESHGKKRN